MPFPILTFSPLAMPFAPLLDRPWVHVGIRDGVMEIEVERWAEMDDDLKWKRHKREFRYPMPKPEDQISDFEAWPPLIVVDGRLYEINPQGIKGGLLNSYKLAGTDSCGFPRGDALEARERAKNGEIREVQW